MVFWILWRFRDASAMPHRYQADKKPVDQFTLEKVQIKKRQNQLGESGLLVWND